MIYVYLILSAVLVPISDIFFDVLREPYSWWLVPVLIIAFFLGFVIIHAAVLGISVWLVDLEKPQERFSRYFRVLITQSIKMIVSLVGVQIHTTGKENVPEEGRVMLVCNHLHEIDPAVLIHELPDLELGFIAKKEAYETMPFVARAMHKLHCLPIDRENNREGAKTIVAAIKKLRDDTVSMGVFPEGHCSEDGELHELRNGVFKMAQKAEVPIVVCVIAHTKTFVSRLFKKPIHIYLDILETIPAEKVAEMSTAEIGDYVYSVMAKAIEYRKANKKY